MNDLNQRLQSIFLFDNADLRTNRSGRLSAHQQARLQAARKSQRLALTVFIVVMAGSLAVIAFGALLSGSSSGMDPRSLIVPLIVIAVVIGLVIWLGLQLSRRFLYGGEIRQMAVIRGSAAVGRVREDQSHFELVLGGTRLRLLTREQLDAFQPGVEYRLFYIPGPAPLLLSGEVVGTEAESELILPGEEFPDQEDVVVRMQRRARPILFVLAGLALGIPLLGFAASLLPDQVQWLVWVTMLVAAVGFVYWALRRISS